MRREIKKGETKENGKPQTNRMKKERKSRYGRNRPKWRLE
jgi:hypothetical protein